MAGDWMKLEKATPEKPEVFAIASKTGLDPDAVVGKLVRLWAWFDSHTVDGNAKGVTSALLDRIVGNAGFSQAVTEVGWMEESDGGVTLPNFDRHNGKTAKNRAKTAQRVALYRSGNDPCNEKVVTQSVTAPLAREEKRREEKNTVTSPGKREKRTKDSESSGETKSDPRFTHFRDAYAEEYLTANGVPYNFATSTRWASSLKKFLSGSALTVDEFRQSVSGAFGLSKSNPYSRACPHVGEFHEALDRFNAIQSELQSARGSSSITNGHSVTTEIDNAQLCIPYDPDSVVLNLSHLAK